MCCSHKKHPFHKINRPSYAVFLNLVVLFLFEDEVQRALQKHSDSTPALRQSNPIIPGLETELTSTHASVNDDCASRCDYLCVLLISCAVRLDGFFSVLQCAGFYFLERFWAQTKPGFVHCKILDLEKHLIFILKQERRTIVLWLKWKRFFAHIVEK